MANQEIVVAAALNSTIQVIIRYDDLTLRCNRVRWINISIRNCEAIVIRGGNVLRTVISAGDTGQRNLGAGQLSLTPIVEGTDTSYVWDAAIMLRPF